MTSATSATGSAAKVRTDIARLDQFHDQFCADNLTERRDQKQEAHGIGDKARGQQQHAGHQNANPVKHRADGHFTLIHLALCFGQCLQSLSTHQRGAKNCGQNNHTNGRPQTDDFACLNKYGDLDDRHGDKDGQKIHAHYCSDIWGMTRLLVRHLRRMSPPDHVHLNNYYRKQLGFQLFPINLLCSVDN